MKTRPALIAATAAVAAAFVCVAVGANGASAPHQTLDVRTLVPNPDHRAIFCGVDGGEGSQAYSTVVSRAITVVIERRLATNAAGAIEVLQRGLCAKTNSTSTPTPATAIK